MISYAQNFEDVLLARVFRERDRGFYVDVGAMDPLADSVTKSFYDRGWHGINVEPVERFWAALAAQRPRDVNIRAAVTDRTGEATFYCVVDTGLSSLNADALSEEVLRSQTYEQLTVPTLTLAELCEQHATEPIDFLKVDVEGAELEVLRGGDWRRFRPTIVVVEAVKPNTQTPSHAEWEPILTSNGYQFAVFDGLNRFYVTRESTTLIEVLQLSPNYFDHFVQWRTVQAEADLARVHQQLAVSDADRAARLRSIEVLEKQLLECEADRAARLEAMTDLSLRLAAMDEELNRARHEFSLAPRQGQNMAERAVLRRLNRVVVDLTPLLPGGENGGARLVPLSVLPHFAALAPDAEFILLTHYRNHDALAEFDAPNIRRHLVVQADPTPDPSSAALANVVSLVRGSARRFLPSPVRKKLRHLGLASLNPGRSTPSAAQPAPDVGLLQELQADVLFCPFTAPYYSDPRVPLVSVVYDIQYVYYPYNFTEHERAERARTFAAACQFADRLICISDFVRGTVLENSQVAPDRVVTVHIGRLQKLPDPQPEAVRQVLTGLRLTAGRFLLFPANFWPHKNHRMLLTAFALYRSRQPESNLQLVCTGSPNAEMDELRTAADAMGIGRIVVFPGFVSSRDLAALYQTCLALVFPSLYEGFGMPILEAMASDKPVLCSNVTSLPEIAGDAALMFDPRKPDDIARCIELIDVDHDLRASLVRRGHHRASQFGDAAALADTYLRIFREIIEGQTRHFGAHCMGCTPMVGWGETCW